MLKGKHALDLLVLCALLTLLAVQAQAACPGIGRFLGELFGKATIKKVAAKSTTKFIGNTALKVGARTLPMEARTITRKVVSDALAKAAPRPWVTPGQIYAGGAAGGMILVGRGVGNSAEQIGSETARALADVFTGKADSSAKVIEKTSALAQSVSQTALFYAFLIFIFCTGILFWRFNLMPWQRPCSKAAPPASPQSNEVPRPKVNTVPMYEIIDAEIVKEKG